MTPDPFHLVRVAYNGGFRQHVGGPAWRHLCGTIIVLDLLADRPGDRVMPPRGGCEGCSRGSEPGTWKPLLIYTGPLCDQCHGNGFVPIAGKHDGAICGYETVTPCTACSATGIASPQQPADPGMRPVDWNRLENPRRRNPEP